MEGSADIRIVLLGKTGVGKSSTCNSILGTDFFQTSSEVNSDTPKCEALTRTVDGRKITVVDTPGFFSTDCSVANSDKELKAEIVKCIIECSPGPHAFLIVLPVRRQTAEEKKVVEEILGMFGEEVLKYAVVLFTHGKQLQGMPIQQFVEKNNHLKKLVQKCGERLHVVDNTEWNNPAVGHGHDNNYQIKKLLNTIDRMVEQNGGEHYTNKMLEAAEQAIESNVAYVKKRTRVKLSEFAARVKAKQIVIKRFLIRAVGTATGVLLGALFGVVASVKLVVGLLAKEFPSAGAAGAAAAAVAVGAVAATASTATGIGLGVVAGAGALTGAIAGGVIGAREAKEAKTLKEAAKRAAVAIRDKAKAAEELLEAAW